MRVSLTLADTDWESIIVGNCENVQFLPRCEKKSIEIQVTKISNHVSKLDFEDEYGEIR